MRLAVVTSKYPARVATFFERDMRALIDAGLDLEVFPIYPLDEDRWRYSLDLLNEHHLPRERVHHLNLSTALRRAAPAVRARPARALSDATAVLAAAARYGPLRLAKSAYPLPKAWAWFAEHAHRFDHILAYWGNYAGTCAYAFHRLLDRPIPFSIWLHAGTDLYRAPIFMRQKLLYADNVITCCEFNREFMLRRYADLHNHLAPRIHVCHHGLNLADFPYRPDGRAPRRVVAVGRLARAKGFDYLLRATKLLHASGIDLTVELVGEGDERRALQLLAADLGIVDRVRFAGWVRFPEARRAMSEATLLVHPSVGLGDGLPNVVREAMALGTPVIASRVAGIPEALSDGCGLLVEPRDSRALAAAIAGLIDDAPTRRCLAERARRRVEERFDMWRNGTRLARLLSHTRRGAFHLADDDGGGSDRARGAAAAPHVDASPLGRRRLAPSTPRSPGRLRYPETAT